MKKAIALLALIGMIAPLGVSAQDSPPQGDLMIVSQWRVEPGHMEHQSREIAKIAEAAKMAKITDPGASWYTWTSANQYTLVYPFPNFAFLDVPQAFEKMFEGKPGEEMVMEAMKSMQTIPGSESMSEIVMRVPDWTYEPDPDFMPRYAQVTEVWLKPGQDEAFDGLVKDFLQLRKDVGYPYNVHGHRVLFGDTGRMVFVDFYNDRSAFYGEESVEAYIEKAGRAEDHQKLIGKLIEMSKRWDQKHLDFQAGLSFIAAMQEYSQ